MTIIVIIGEPKRVRQGIEGAQIRAVEEASLRYCCSIRLALRFHLSRFFRLPEKPRVSRPDERKGMPSPSRMGHRGDDERLE